MAVRPRVLLMHPILEPGRRPLAEACEILPYPEGAPLTERSIRAAAEGCSGIVSQMMDPIGADVLALPGLRIVTNVGAHYSNIDVGAASRHRVMVTNTPDDSTQAVADFTFGLMITAARRILDADRSTRGGHFQGWQLDGFLGEDLYGSTLGIIGFDQVGRAIANRGRGFEMRTLRYDPPPADPAAGDDDPADVTAVTVDELLTTSDFVCVRAARHPANIHLISARELGLMKTTAVLVNTSRGIVDEAALVDALRRRQLFAAAVDVFENEPHLSPGLAELPNVVLGAHCHSASRRLRAQRSLVAARDVIAGVLGKRPVNLVNSDAFEFTL
jgi:glyoxylate reductase